MITNLIRTTIRAKGYRRFSSTSGLAKLGLKW